ncbi:hypothetical protein ACFVTY_32810 [Streptomyces sp. NPDC058067]|uniref:hypothetical protein n=1 Tax=Streptomyces sp. NPDC058067 TaxID=3346324 RepID=UPI0036EABC3A
MTYNGPSRSVGRLGVWVAVSAAGLGLIALSGCGSSHQVAGGGGADRPADRARRVAAAWDGSAASAAWRVGYYPMGESVQLPRGGLSGTADKRAYRDRNVVLRGKLPGTGPKDGRVKWASGQSLTRPLTGAGESLKSLAGTGARARNRSKPQLTVTGVKLGEMRLATSRGPATVPAWLFTLDGYASPLKQAAAVPSKHPQPPIRPAQGMPGYPVDRLVRIAADGRSVAVIALHGVCDQGASVDVLETRGSVVLSASTKGDGHDGNCTKQARMQGVTVKLQRPLGDRALLDAHTGRPVPYKGLRGVTASRS